MVRFTEKEEGFVQEVEGSNIIAGKVPAWAGVFGETRRMWEIRSR